MEPKNNNRPQWFCESSALSLDDQQWIWENIKEESEKEWGSVSVNGSVNGAYKNGVNSELSWDKSKVISLLKQCTSDTPPIQVSAFLEELFKPWASKDGHWLWIAQTYTPRALNWAFLQTEKEYLRGAIRTNPSAYFTYDLRFRKKRKSFRSTNGIHKHQNME
ncbi:MAG: hypothetical protein G01um10145_815 [Microgenomates group bacterium Gr01-1014_5]|nr:MAG: hypothetical protein G01um10145_815 [Microgenomates group bacterium Gr01-1014_5]